MDDNQVANRDSDLDFYNMPTNKGTPESSSTTSQNSQKTSNEGSKSIPVRSDIPFN